ncbi:hypothetical protein [Terriglobus roseus]|uniref:Cytochrome c domain-containing protein n=1 Tax=Terriglobus roseus TaxID=392734 RepID=A0A1G7N9T6_9BACT|nr:hypothetical protein [Terriglobus roseus]SDF70793.1 hypothetical protein SAMN05444167_3064 [Terriglobus roseus]
MLKKHILMAATACGFLILTGCKTDTPNSAQPVVKAALPAVAVPAQAGSVQGKSENSDAFIWELFTQFTAPASPGSASPVEFETWASDADTFTSHPHWPTTHEPLHFHKSVLQLAKMGEATLVPHAISAAFIDVPCGGNPPTPPPGAGGGGFPNTGTPTPCIAEQVSRNRTNYNDIVNNNLNTQAGRAAAYKAGKDVEMEPNAMAIKGDWVPLPTLLQWLPSLGSLDNIRKQYYTTTSGSTEYALLSIHVASRQNPNWVWGSFEHQMNPGRCDYMGCFDTFGAVKPAIMPNRTDFNAGYGTCEKTPALKAMMQKANLSPVWDNYCLKSTEVDFTAADGTPYALGNSVIEGIVGNGTVAASSCISCHSYASFGATGAPTTAATNILPYNPVGKPIPTVLTGSKTFAFNWGLLTQQP